MIVWVNHQGPVWPFVIKARANVPKDERALMSGKMFDFAKDRWYVIVSGQWCIFE